MAVSLREFIMADYDAAIALWQASEGIGLSEADSRESIQRFLSRNPGTSFVVIDNGALVGAVLGGSDGRRGHLHHLAVAAARRGAGLGRALVDRCLAALAAAGIRKCHVFVIRDNADGMRFWPRIGWTERTTLAVMSRDLPG